MASEAPRKPLKGILKKPAQPQPQPTNPPDDTADEAKQTALKHATILQDRKDRDGLILDAILQLAALPTTTTTTPSTSNDAPSPADAALFRALVRPFQPTEYDDLVAERNTLGACGYALCARRRRTFAGAGAWKLVGAGGPDFAIARRADLERWCSDACARRALYVKVQLLETDAWERAGVPDFEIELLGEGEGGGTGTVAGLRLDEGRRRREAEGKAALALERGDGPAAGPGGRGEQLVEVDIMERRTVVAPTPPTPSGGGNAETAHRAIEGHTPRFGGKEG